MSLRAHLEAQGWSDAADIVAEIEAHRSAQLLACWELPWPPAANNLYPTVMIGGKPRRIAGKRSKEYTKAVGQAMLGQRPLPHGMPLDIHIRCYPPDSRRRDLDGIPKGVLDGLVKAGMMRDDSDIWSLTMYRECLRAPPGRVVVEVRQHVMADEAPRGFSVGEIVNAAQAAIADCPVQITMEEGLKFVNEAMPQAVAKMQARLGDDFDPPPRRRAKELE